MKTFHMVISGPRNLHVDLQFDAPITKGLFKTKLKQINPETTGHPHAWRNFFWKSQDNLDKLFMPNAVNDKIEWRLEGYTYQVEYYEVEHKGEEREFQERYVKQNPDNYVAMPAVRKASTRKNKTNFELCVRAGVLPKQPIQVVTFDIDAFHMPRMRLTNFDNVSRFQSLTEEQVQTLMDVGLFNDAHMQILYSERDASANINQRVADDVDYAISDISTGFGKRTKRFMENLLVSVRNFPVEQLIISESKSHLELNAKVLETMSFEEIYNFIGDWVTKNQK
jgi:hypothetical protein